MTKKVSLRKYAVLETDFISRATGSLPDFAHFKWSAPSNIALVKYWGKMSGQIPANPSLSLTLDRCKTITSVRFEKAESNKKIFNLTFDGAENEEFRPKIHRFLERIMPYCPYLQHYHLQIDTTNTFPHSSGIASSASAMAALAVNIMSLEKLVDPNLSDEKFYQKASFLARLGSGSACRSINGKVVAWGQHHEISGSSSLFGVEVSQIHPVFNDYQDTILLVDKGKKQVSSTAGHDLMNNHPYAERRFMQASENVSTMKNILQTGNLEQFVAITESEALTLHAMMMTSMPYFILMKPNTLQIIEKIWEFRRNTNIPICFTLDAGANVHTLYPRNHAPKVMGFIKAELIGWCENGQYICDEVGNGATLISNE